LIVFIIAALPLSERSLVSSNRGQWGHHENESRMSTPHYDAAIGRIYSQPRRITRTITALGPAPEAVRNDDCLSGHFDAHDSGQGNVSVGS
jgi:hypothetical protein